MHRGEHEFARAKAQLSEQIGPGSGARHEQTGGFGERAAHHPDSLSRNALAEQLLTVHLDRYQAQVGQGVGEDAVVLFGHRPIETTHPGLEVHEAHPGGVGRQGTGQTGIGITLYQHGAHVVLEQHPFDLLGCPADLGAACETPDREVMGEGDAGELGEDGLAHRVVEVLAGVHHHRSLA